MTNIPFLLIIDLDMAYVAAYSEESKTIFAPDFLFESNQDLLKFIYDFLKIHRDSSSNSGILSQLVLKLNKMRFDLNVSIFLSFRIKNIFQCVAVGYISLLKKIGDIFEIYLVGLSLKNSDREILVGATKAYSETFYHPRAVLITDPWTAS